MKAIRVHKHGALDRLMLDEVPIPEPGEKEVLIEVKACALNHLDLWVRRGLPAVKIPLPIIPGSDISGTVSKFGKLVTSLKKGAKVVLAPGVSCGRCEACLKGDDHLCPEYSILGFNQNGGYAEYVCVPEANVLPMPEGLTYVEAASVPLVFMTAWHMLVTRAKLQPGEDALILGGASGVGSAGIQIAKMFGARVLTTVSTDEKRSKAIALGADDVINYKKKDIHSEVMRRTNKKGVNVLIEHVGKATWEKSILSLARNGRLVTCGATTGHLVKLDLRFLFSKHLSLLGSYMGSKAELIEALKYFPKKLHPVVDRVVSLKDAKTAHTFLEEGRQFGKIVLTPLKTGARGGHRAKKRK